jgi:hypothetical protein
MKAYREDKFIPAVGTALRGKSPKCPLNWWMFGDSGASVDALE